MYNGHESWTAWNISLWINSSEDLYFIAKDLVGLMGAKHAATIMYEGLAGATTPDGAEYNERHIFLAIQDLEG